MFVAFDNQPFVDQTEAQSDLFLFWILYSGPIVFIHASLVIFLSRAFKEVLIDLD